MLGKRKYVPKKAYAKKQRTITRSKWATAPSGQMGGTIHRVQQIVNIGTFTSTTATPVLSSVTFSFNTLPNATDFEGMYDQYRVDKMTVHFVPACNFVSQSYQCGMLYTAKDYNNAVSPSTGNAVLEYQSAKISPSYEHHYRSLIPSCNAVDALGNTLMQGRPWVPITSTTTSWYGVKYAMICPYAATTFSMQIFVTVHLSFKNVN